jgi:hypothetical protein
MTAKRPKTATPTPAEFRVAEALRNSPGGPEWIRRSQALTAGEARAFEELGRRATARREAQAARVMDAIIAAMKHPVGVVKMREGRPKGSRSALGRVVEAYWQQAPDGRRTFEAVWDHLRALVGQDDATVHEVLDRTAECHPAKGAHVDWWIAPGRLRATDKKALLSLLQDVARTLGLPIA